MSPFFSGDNWGVLFIHSFEFLTPRVERFCIDSPRTEVFTDWRLGCRKCSGPWSACGACGPGMPRGWGVWTALQPWEARSAGPSFGRAEFRDLHPFVSLFLYLLWYSRCALSLPPRMYAWPSFRFTSKLTFHPGHNQHGRKGPLAVGAVRAQSVRSGRSRLLSVPLLWRWAWGRRHCLNKTTGKIPYFLTPRCSFSASAFNHRFRSRFLFRSKGKCWVINWILCPLFVASDFLFLFFLSLLL